MHLNETAYVLRQLIVTDISCCSERLMLLTLQCLFVIIIITITATHERIEQGHKQLVQIHAFVW
jgi:hypothetical protein